MHILLSPSPGNTWTCTLGCFDLQTTRVTACRRHRKVLPCHSISDVDGKINISSTDCHPLAFPSPSLKKSSCGLPDMQLTSPHASSVCQSKSRITNQSAPSWDPSRKQLTAVASADGKGHNSRRRKHTKWEFSWEVFLGCGFCLILYFSVFTRI